MLKAVLRMRNVVKKIQRTMKKTMRSVLKDQNLKALNLQKEMKKKVK